MPEPKNTQVDGGAAGEWRELDSRSAENDRVMVALQWKAPGEGHEEQLRVQVADLRSPDPVVLHIAVRSPADASEAFMHPYAYGLPTETAPVERQNSDGHARTLP